MESPLSFDSTENFRKKLLLKNLKPYKVDGFYVSNDGSKNTEIVLIDYSVIDEQTVDVEAKLQEPKLIGLNKYTPIGGTFGELVSINLNLNSETNFGNYTYIQSEGSKLQNFGRIKELELIYKAIEKTETHNFNADFYWSSSEFYMAAYYFNFRNGYSTYIVKGHKNTVRMVRTIQNQKNK